ncbi:FepA family TonB-dependent siderophore receptor [Rhizobiaceae bacterium BDR2-2]|uniref:FepA family TonB-dependent siderophore receptor n=1 Tax=Ectorhizobium quercum TaxID=2965071 RepID=A0AAE3MWY6_9HYPH|nr:FepA family TonB-dependent siderophore receptor [Ectorhizobium quercum]MCX8995966.1 FepA family TonB-dependent siderophore receptor [Ectorhizobium quercum]
MGRRITSFRATTALGLVLSIGASHAFAQSAQSSEDENGETVLEEIVVLSAEEQLKQSLGVSVITSTDLERRPVGRDLAEIIRTQPGVNLTGNTSSGQYGQSRQIDLRGMGPENTLILIDGKPVFSRNSQRMGRQGERDTRGDSNWVPAELIERVEVIRGPAAARYGSGAAGGVVNIITKRPEKQTYSLTTYVEVPEDSKEGGTRRVTATAGGPINDIFNYRLTASGSWTDPDDTDINADAAAEEGLDTIRAGREGVKSYNLRGLLSAEIDGSNRLDFEAAWSRQANSFAGGQPSGSIGTPGDIINELAESNAETSRIDRTTLSVTHIGDYEFGKSNSYIQWEHTANRRLREPNNAGGEGVFDTDNEYRTAKLDNLNAKTEWVLPLHLWREQKVTLGTEYRGEFLSAPISGDAITNNDKNHMETHLIGLYVEDNVLLTDRFTLTPGLRFDWHDSFGANLSPSLNASYEVTDEITLKAGIARAFKAPNVYQLSPDYVWGSMGMGCPIWADGQCSMRGNPDLDPEISLNKEIGIAYANLDGWAASLTYYHNDYKNKITTGDVQVGWDGTTRLFSWENSGPAIISGLEGSVTVPLHERVEWTTNFTKILKSEREVFGQLADGTDGNYKVPVSLVPDYTINSSVRWEAREDLGLTLSATHYGEIEPTNRNARGQEIPAIDQEARKPYTIVNLSLDYDYNENVKVAAGVNNLFNKQLYATGGGVGTGTTSSANTYNEPGRTYWVSLTGTF